MNLLSLLLAVLDRVSSIVVNNIYFTCNCVYGLSRVFFWWIFGIDEGTLCEIKRRLRETGGDL